MQLKEQLIEYASTLADFQMDRPFRKFPEYIALRHKSSGKWFGLIMSVERSKLNLPGTGKVEIIDIKADPEVVSILKNGEGYQAAYHMNKAHWLTIVLDGKVDNAQIQQLLEDSYRLTKN